jgi:predicted dienelactone hydrolase
MTGLRLFLLAAVATAGSPALASGPVGVRDIAVVAPERQEPLSVTLWYPAGEGGTPERVGENKVFRGAPVLRDAGVAEGAHPVVVLAHGGMRAAPNQSGWIASALAARGMLVAVVPPPRPASPEAAVAEIWLRPADLSAALTAVEAEPAIAGHAEPGPAAAVGFFLGGTSVLSLAGARLDAESHARSCDTPAGGADCAWFAAAGVDLRAADAVKLARSGFDPRIGTVVAIDPELTAHLAAGSFTGMTARVTVINLGDPGSIAPFLDASGLQAEGVAYTALAGATPFSAMAACQPHGAGILAEEGEDDEICREDAALRERTHARLADMIAEAVGNQ